MHHHSAGRKTSLFLLLLSLCNKLCVHCDNLFLTDLFV